MPSYDANDFLSVVREWYAKDAVVREWREGLDFIAFLVVSDTRADAVLRVPRQTSTDNVLADSATYAQLIDKECAAYRLIHQAAIPAPKLLAFDTSCKPVPFPW